MKEWLEQYPYLCAKAARLQNEMDKLRGNHVIHGVVIGSSPHPPYAKRCIAVDGSDASDADKVKLSRVRAEHEDTCEQIKAIENHIAREPSLRMREILTRKIIHGEKWAEIAAAFGCGETEDGLKKAYSRYFQRCHECHQCHETMCYN